MDRKPLYVDLDGTLIKSDLLHESLLGLLKSNPLVIFLLPIWLRRGRANFKQAIAQRVEIDAASLPYSESFLEYLKQESASGRALILATASDQKYARQVSSHLGLFVAMLASDGKVNLSGCCKADAIEVHAGGRPFDYAGNSHKDVPIWNRADGAVLVNADRGVEAALGSKTSVVSRFVDRRVTLARYLAALRPHQWAKNLLLFVVLLMSHRFTDPDALMRVLAGFVAFSLCASSVYVLNDLLDLAADRRHPRKRRRPFAAGDIPVSYGFMVVPLLTLLSLGIAATLSLAFLGVLIAYLLMTVAYSFRLKHYVLIDVMVLAALFTTRVIAGGVAIDVLPSFWLLAFCVFLFTSLALVKRCAELVTMAKQGADGRDYRVADTMPLMAMGIASGYAAVLVVAFYINSSAVTVLYGRPEVLWLLCPVLLYWVSRLWLKTHRGEMHDDPLLYAVTDRASRYIGLATAVILLAAI
jgi:4-hydroxybenzoate polyprenyltransferase